jgi:nicotinamide phosphoribosyltransferase
MIQPLVYTDFYKTDHRRQYPEGTTLVYSNFTPRGSRIEGVDKVVVYGIQYFIKKILIEDFNNGFFHVHRSVAIEKYKRRLDNALGKDSVPIEHIGELHDLGYLPVIIKALSEGSLCPMRVPLLTIYNTQDRFYWVTNFLETILSTTLWGMINSATIAYTYRKMLDKYAEKTSDIPEFVDFQAHDFSMRGMFGIEASTMSGSAHLLSFKGTDTIPVIDFLEEYYHADSDKELVGCSVPATEHSVMCLGSKETEIETFTRLLTKVYPTGILSVVSDTWDFWKVLTEYLPKIKDIIIKRDGKLVIRPDSGDPADIICGINSRPVSIKYAASQYDSSPEGKGAVETLWDIFGGTINSKGYKQLDPHIGIIYGDSITLERCDDICDRLEKKGFASTNVVFGIGSYCVNPETPILCDDFQWREAGSLKVGQGIVCFNENPTYGNRRTSSRKYTRGEITRNFKAEKESMEIKCGKESIKCSIDHPFLVWGSTQNRDDFYSNKPSKEEVKKTNMPRGKGLIWKKACDLKKEDQIAYFGKPWKMEESREAGWLAGIYDGEGTLCTGVAGRSVAVWKVSVSQNKGVVLDKIRKFLKKRKFNFYENSTSSGCIRNTLTGGFYEHARFLGVVKPERLLLKGYSDIADLPVFKRGYTYKLMKVTSIKKLGIQKIASITTSKGTFITNGFLSHNTYQYNTRDTFGFAMKSTYGEINNEPQVIFKDPLTDDGLKKSAVGLLRVNEDYTLSENVSWQESRKGLLETVFRNGYEEKQQTLSQIRKRLSNKGEI